MATRTCKPDAELKQLWKLLLPGTAMPACGVTEDAGAAKSGIPPSAEEPGNGDRPPLNVLPVPRD